MAARSTFDMNIEGLLGLQAQLALLSLSPKLRRRLLTRVGKRIRTLSAKRVRAQKKLDGSPFVPRKASTKRRRKMLGGLIKAKYLDVVKATPEQATVGWKNRLMGFIAAEHHAGRSRRYTAAQARNANPISYDSACTTEQAKRLRRLGFKVRKASEGKRGKARWVRPSVAWITGNIKYGQAGLLIRELKGERSGPGSWEIKLPKRDFLGADQSDIARLIKIVLEQILHSPR
jgi:hypothetical protein